MTISTIAAASSGQTPDQALTQVQRKEAVVRLLKSFAGGDPGALSIVNANRYTQRNLRLEDGLEGINKRLASPRKV
jgi:hypothetical protein